MIDGLKGRNSFSIHTEWVACVHITVGPWKIAARNFETIAVSLTREDAQSGHIDFKLIHLCRDRAYCKRTD